MYPINAVKTIGNAIVYVSFNISNGSSSFLLYNSIIIFQNNFLFHFTSHNQSLANGKIKFGIDSSGNYGYIKDGADTVIPFKNGKLKIWTSYDYDGSFLTIDDATEIQMVIAFISTNAERCEGRVNCLYKEENGDIFKRYDTNDLNIVINGNTFKFNNPWFGQSQRMNIFVYYK